MVVGLRGVECDADLRVGELLDERFGADVVAVLPRNRRDDIVAPPAVF